MRYDIGIIGGGPGGYVAAIKGAQAGADVILFEEDTVGGTCLNRGCIPTKSLLKSTRLLQEIREAGQYGIEVGGPKADYGKIFNRKDAVVKTLTSGVEGLLKKNKITIVKQRAELENRHSICAGKERYEVEHVILATGSVPARPPVKGIENALDSDGILEMKELPKSMIIMGGGVIGVEFAMIFQVLGVEVTIVEMLPGVLQMADEAVIAAAESMLQKAGVRVITGAVTEEVDTDGIIYTKDGERIRISSEIVMAATGRIPNTNIERLDILGIRHDRGKIETDMRMRTNIPGIYAIGDLNGRSMLAHTASMEASVAVSDIMGESVQMDYSRIPSCVYTVPEIAWIGITEKQAKELNIPVRTGTFPMSANGKSLVEGNTDGMIKLIAHEKTGEILGGHLVCLHATDMIMEIGILMGMEGTAADISQSIHPHPTVSEAILEAAEAIRGKAVHI